VPEVLAADPELGWLLMKDAGTTLRSAASGDEWLRCMDTVFARMAVLQMGCVDHSPSLLALGVPDRRLAGLPEHFARLLDEQEHTLTPAPDALTPGEIREGRRLLGSFADLCSDLASRGVPETLHHDDFHDANVFVDVRLQRPRVADWAESAVTHPFCTLTVGLRSAAHSAGLPEDSPRLGRLVDAYLEPWSAHGTLPELREALNLALRVGRIVRALTWAHLTASLSPAEQRQERAAQGWIRMYLDAERYLQA